MDKIMRGYWDCEYCGTQHIDGLVDVCPNCGKQKSADVRYYVDDTSTEVSDTELNAAGIIREECDGEHPDWVCPYCNQLNNYADDVCVACGGLKSESECNYQDFNEEPVQEEVKVSGKHAECKEGSEHSSNKLYRLLVMFMSVLILSTLVFSLIPYKEKQTVMGFSWSRTITVENLKTFNESDWYLPSRARLKRTSREFHYYQQVVDHYETKTRQKSRLVQDGYNISYTMRNNGNGTFTQKEHKTPKYKTEYYTETYQAPVYRNRPVYDTKYYYEIDRWVADREYPSSGNDKKPYWSATYVLKKKQRDSSRQEVYYVYYVSDSGKKTKVKARYGEWKNISKGDQYVVTTCRLGIVYDKRVMHQNEVVCLVDSVSLEGVLL